MDHRNHNTLDNRRKNLRVCSQSLNSLNRIPGSTASSGLRGVHWHEAMHRWRARVYYMGKEMVLGYFDNPQDAFRIVNLKLNEILDA